MKENKYTVTIKVSPKQKRSEMPDLHNAAEDIVNLFVWCYVFLYVNGKKIPEVIIED